MRAAPAISALPTASGHARRTHQDSSEYPSGPLIYEIARGRQRDQLAQREAYRTRSGRLLAFAGILATLCIACLLYTSPSPRDRQKSRMPSSA